MQRWPCIPAAKLVPTAVLPGTVLPGMVPVIGFGGGVRHGARGQALCSLFQVLKARGLSLDPMEESSSAAFVSWMQYIVT